MCVALTGNLTANFVFFLFFPPFAFLSSSPQTFPDSLQLSNAALVSTLKMHWQHFAGLTEAYYCLCLYVVQQCSSCWRPVCSYSADICTTILLLIRYHLGKHLVFRKLMVCSSRSQTVRSKQTAPINALIKYRREKLYKVVYVESKFPLSIIWLCCI